MSADAKQLGSLVPLPAKAREPRSAASADCWGNRYRLHIGHRGWATEQANVRGERGLQPWFSLFSLKALDQGGLLPAYICTGSAVDIDVKVVPGTTSVLADEACGVGFVDSLLDDHKSVE